MKDTVSLPISYLFMKSLPYRRSSDSPAYDTDCSSCSDGFVKAFDGSCHDCSETSSKIAVAVVSAVSVVLLLTAIIIWRHLGRGVEGDVRGPPGTLEGFLQRKITFFHQIMLKALPLTAIKITVVVWQVVFQV